MRLRSLTGTRSGAQLACKQFLQKIADDFRPVRRCPDFDHEHAVRIKLAARGVISAPHRDQALRRRSDSIVAALVVAWCDTEGVGKALRLAKCPPSIRL